MSSKMFADLNYQEKISLAKAINDFQLEVETGQLEGGRTEEDSDYFYEQKENV